VRKRKRRERTSFLLFAFQVAIALLLIVRWIELTMTEFREPPPPACMSGAVGVVTFPPSRSRW
jgi:hypothetical protein